MTRDDAVTIVGMIVYGWPGKDWEQERMASYVDALLPLDAEVTTRALARARNTLQYRPSIAELREFIQIERRMSETEEARFVAPEKLPKPTWVERWERARQAGDMRPFPEQMNALDALARFDADHYRVYHPPEHPVTDREHWIQGDEYLEVVGAAVEPTHAIVRDI